MRNTSWRRQAFSICICFADCHERGRNKMPRGKDDWVPENWVARATFRTFIRYCGSCKPRQLALQKYDLNWSWQTELTFLHSLSYHWKQPAKTVFKKQIYRALKYYYAEVSKDGAVPQENLQNVGPMLLIFAFSIFTYCSKRFRERCFNAFLSAVFEETKKNVGLINELVNSSSREQTVCFKMTESEQYYTDLKASSSNDAICDSIGNASDFFIQ